MIKTQPEALTEKLQTVFKSVEGFKEISTYFKTAAPLSLLMSIHTFTLKADCKVLKEVSGNILLQLLLLKGMSNIS